MVVGEVWVPAMVAGAEPAEEATALVESVTVAEVGMETEMAAKLVEGWAEAAKVEAAREVEVWQARLVCRAAAVRVPVAVAKVVVVPQAATAAAAAALAICDCLEAAALAVATALVEEAAAEAEGV